MQSISRRKIAIYISDQLAAGKPVKPLLSQAASYLVEHKQTNQAELLVRDIEALLASEHDIVLARVISARELSTGLIASIKQYVAGAQGARTVEVSTSVDPSLLGGVIVRTPSAEFDASIRKQLNELRA